ncbi:MAG: RNA 2'-phosphotransferase [Planctomycetota bacterium]|nr:MAG: RNA 2'-phosphotransferase [Planctomycetota bacterium]
MDSKRRTKLSKFLSYILRHHPEKIGLNLDKNGWADVNTLLEKCQQHNIHITRNELEEVVKLNSKQRFAFSPDNTKIRSNQGHSIPVELDYEPTPPPNILYHGTSERFLDSIRQKGLQKKQRHHVHLSSDMKTALEVGKRHGKPIVLKIKAREMSENGFTFYLTSNNVWLVETVPPTYLIFP